MLPWSLVPKGLLVSVRVKAKSSRDEIAGVERYGDKAMLTARVCAVASEGEANRALIRLIAGELDVAPTSIAVIGGATARIKRLLIEGDGPALAGKLQRIVGDMCDGRKDH